MSTGSRHRLTLTAGAIVAGAAIPIAAAGSAWADDSLADLTSLVAAGNGQPMEISFDGQVLIDTCGKLCTAVSATDNDLAIAYGDGSKAYAEGGQGDKALASDGGVAESGVGNDDTASATGYGTIAYAANGNGDSATANGEDLHVAAAYGNNDTASATGYQSSAVAEDGNNDSATADGTGDYAGAGGEGDQDNNYDTAIANGDDSTAEAGLGYNHDYASASDGYSAYADYANHLTIIEPAPLDPAAIVDPAAVIDPAAVDPAGITSLIP